MEIPTKPAEGISLATWAVVFILSGWGGAVHFVRQIRESKGTAFTLAELIGDLIISTFVGVVVFILCKATEQSDLLSVGLACIASNMGSKALYMIEVWTTRKAEKYVQGISKDRRNSNRRNSHTED